MRMIAHRGFDGQYSANTVAAVEQAVPDADMIELDVHRCASDELVVAHNPLVDISIEGVSRVDELTVDELAALDAHDGEGVQTLESVLGAIPPETGINIELKDPAVVEDALEIARSVDNEVIVSSFEAEAIRRVTVEGGRGVELAYILGLTPNDDLTVAKELDCKFVHPNAWLCLLTGVTKEAQRAGMEVNAWTVDSRPGAWALDRKGVDGVIASSPHVAGWIE